MINKQIKFYVNGVLVETISYTNQATGGTSDKVEFGRNLGTGTSNNGTVYSADIFNRQLTDDEIKQDYLKEIRYW